jgi:hypothetical protein
MFKSIVLGLGLVTLGGAAEAESCSNFSDQWVTSAEECKGAEAEIGAFSVRQDGCDAVVFDEETTIQLDGITRDIGNDLKATATWWNGNQLSVELKFEGFGIVYARTMQFVEDSAGKRVEVVATRSVVGIANQPEIVEQCTYRAK